MSDLPTHADRWRHRTTARVTQHWSATDPNRTHPGPVAGCELCRPKRLPNGLTPEQDAAFDALAQAIADHLETTDEA